MEQILELHEQEDIHSIRDRLELVESERVLLVVPPFSDVLRRRVDLQLVQRLARQKKLELALVTRDLDRRTLAGELGIPVFGSIEAGRRRSRWGREDDDFGPYRPPDRSEARRAAVDRVQRIMPNETRRKLWTIGKTALIVAVAVALIASVVAVLPSAEIYLVPQSERVATTATIVVDPDLESVDLAGKRVPARSVSTDVRGEITIPTTGKKAIPTTRATGVVFFVNQLNIPVRVQKGTVVRTSAGAQATRFVVVADVEVPAGISAQAQAPIEAVEVGAQGNVPPNFINEIEGFAALSLRVSNPDETKGGGDREVTAVDPGDLDMARVLLIEQLKKQALDQMTATNLEPTEFLLASSISNDGVIDATFDKEVTEQATELTLQMRARFSALAVNSEDANAIVFAQMQAESPAAYALRPDGLVFQRSTEQPVTDAAQYVFEMQGIGYAAADIDVGRALRSIAGKPPEAAARILEENLPLQKPPRIIIHPGWFPLVPLLPVRVNTIVDASG